MDEETKDVTKEEVQDEQQDEDNKYSIYDYLRENGSFLVGCGSVAVTLVAICLKFASYLYHLAYLRYWNIDPTLVAAPENYWYENIGLSFLMIVVTLIYYLWITKILGEKKVRKSEAKKVRKIGRKIAKIENEKHKNIATQIASLEEARMDHAIDYYLSQKENLDLKLQEIETTQDELSKTNSEINRMSLAIWLKYAFKLIAVTILCGSLITIAFLQKVDTIKEALIIVIVSSIAIIIAAQIHVWMNDKFENGESVLLAISTRKKISNYWLAVLIGGTLVGCSVYSLYEYHSGNKDASLKTEFNVTCVHDTACAIISADSDYLVAEEIKISDDSKSATIYSDSVFIISKENEPVLEKKSFEKPPIVIAKGEDE